MNFWEIGGYQSCVQTSNHYYKNCFAAFIVFDLTSNESFVNVHNYIRQICEQSSCMIVLLGNKSDLNAKKVHYSEIQTLMNTYSHLNIHYFDISAKDYKLTKEIFTRVASIAFNKIEEKLKNPEQLWETGIKCTEPINMECATRVVDTPDKNTCSIV